MTEQIVYLNGLWMPIDEAKVPVLDRGFIFGDGIYEVVPIYNGKPFRWEQHLNRLQRSLDKIGITNPHSREQWTALVKELQSKHTWLDQFIYIQVTRGVAKRDHAFPKVAVTPTVFAMASEFVHAPVAQREQGVAAVSLPDERWLHCDVKSTSLLGNVLAKQAAVEAGGFECVMFRNGFLTGSWNARAYAVVIVAGYALALPVMIMLARRIVTAEFDPAIVAFGDMVAFIARPFVALAHAAVIIAVVKSGAVPRFVARVAAAGRMALSNYLATSVVATMIFYGYGLGMFAQFGRAQLYAVVAIIWAMMLLWSKPWLDRFRYGPAEWLWRSLSRWKFETMRLPVPADG